MYSRDNFEIGLTGIEFFFIPVDIVRTLPPPPPPSLIRGVGPSKN